MSFLDQLKSQASSVREQQAAAHRDTRADIEDTERACKQVWDYLRELANQLNVLQPSGARFTLDDKTPWPAMRLERFGVDARKKMQANQELFDYVAMGWTLTPQMGVPVGGAVTVTYLPDVDRIQKRLTQAQVPHERKEQRHPERHHVQSVRFEYTTQGRAYVMVKALHDVGQVQFRLTNVTGFDVQDKAVEARLVNHAMLDELAKLLVGQTSTFL